MTFIQAEMEVFAAGSHSHKTLLVVISKLEPISKSKLQRENAGCAWVVTFQNVSSEVNSGFVESTKSRLGRCSECSKVWRFLP